MTKFRVVFVAILCWSLLDLLISLLLYVRFDFNNWNLFANGVFMHRVESSPFDVFIVAILRLSLILGCTFGRSFSRDKQAAVKRLHRLTPLVAIATIIVLSYFVVKFLISKEYDENGHLVVNHNSTVMTVGHNSKSEAAYHPWLWAMLGWSAFATCVAAGAYYALYRVNDDLSPKGYQSLSINSSVGINSLIEMSDSDDSDSNDGNEGSDVDSDSDKEMQPVVNGKPKSKKKLLSVTKQRGTVWRLLKMSMPDIGFILTGFLFLALAAASDTFQPYYFGQVIDSIAIKQNESAFFQAILIICGLALISSLGAGLRGMCFLISMARLNVRIRNRLFASLVRQEIGFFDTTKTGSITSRLTSDTTKMSDQLSLNLNIFLRSAARSVGSLVFMFSLSWKLTIVVLLQVPIIALITYYYGKYYKKLSKAVQTSLAKANDVADEVLSSVRTVRSFANELKECDRYSLKLKTTFRLNVKQAMAYFGYQSTNRGLELMSDVAILYYGGWLVLHTEVTAGHLVSFILYAEELAGALEDIGSVFTGLMQAVGAADKVFTLIDRKPKIDHYEGSIKPETLQGCVEFRNVSFAYPSRPDSLVLRNVSFKAEPGDVIALVGVSGGGKTSCISLLQRFYDPLSGSVLIDSRPLASYDHKFLHTKMSVVGQEPVLYASTIEDNIAYGMDDIDRDAVVAAAELANAHTFIDTMSKGYRTQTGEKGVQLSGGQKQRLAIARAVIRDPAILLLDEATSALDAESEHLVQDGLYRKMKDKTVVVVAHRLSTVENATKIIVIDKGVVVEQGTHHDLLKIGGLYAKLVQRQLMPARQNQNIFDPLTDSEQIVNMSSKHQPLQPVDVNSDSVDVNSNGDESSSGSMNF